MKAPLMPARTSALLALVAFVSFVFIAAPPYGCSQSRRSFLMRRALGSNGMPGETVAFARHATDGGLGKMGGEDHGVGFGCVVHRPSARPPRGLWELAEYGVPVWPHELERMVHHVAPEQCLFAPGIKADAGVVNT